MCIKYIMLMFYVFVITPCVFRTTLLDIENAEIMIQSVETPYNIIGDSLARRFALYLDGSHDKKFLKNYHSKKLIWDFNGLH